MSTSERVPVSVWNQSAGMTGVWDIIRVVRGNFSERKKLFLTVSLFPVWCEADRPSKKPCFPLRSSVLEHALVTYILEFFHILCFISMKFSTRETVTTVFLIFSFLSERILREGHQTAFTVFSTVHSGWVMDKRVLLYCIGINIKCSFSET